MLEANENFAQVCFTLLIVILCLAPLALYINLVVRDVITAASPILEKMGVTERELHRLLDRIRKIKNCILLLALTSSYHF